MFMNHAIARQYLSLVGLLLSLGNLSACGSSVQGDVSAVSQAQPPAVSRKAAGTHQAKPGSLVTWVDASPIYLQPGEPSAQVLVLAVSQELGQMQVAIVDAAPLEISSQQHQWQFDLVPGGRYELPLQLSSAAPGRFYLRLKVQIRQGDQLQERQLLRVVQVGPIQQRMQKPAAGDEVISLPAQETIIQPENNRAP